MNYHSPVLLRESIENLTVLKDGVYVDATLGHGGHTIEILKKKGIVYGFDQDPKNLEIASQRIKSLGLEKNFFAVNKNFINIKSFLKKRYLFICKNDKHGSRKNTLMKNKKWKKHFIIPQYLYIVS